MKTIKIVLSGFILLFALTGCAKFKQITMTDSDGPISSPQQGYAAAQQAKDAGLSERAINKYEQVLATYPTSVYAKRAQHGLINIYFEKEKFAEAAAEADQYIHLYPRAKDVDYAYYMKARSHYATHKNALLTFFKFDQSLRDLAGKNTAYRNFSELVTRFPSSRYVPKSREYMVKIENLFADKQYYIANYYYKRRKYVAAINRANIVVEQYPRAKVAPKALKMIAKANRALGLEQPARDAEKYLKQRYA